jgi:hypothetical protein
MKSHFVHDGRARLPDNRKRLAQLKGEIRARHDNELAKAGFIQQLKLRWHIMKEYRTERRKIEPSPHSLFARWN